MKFLVALCVLALVALSASSPQRSKRCIYVLGHCYRQCEEGTYGYTTGCGYLTPEPTCDNPTPVADTRGHICDYSACYCNPPTVRDSISRKCVKLDDCPPKKDDKDSKEDAPNKDDKESKDDAPKEDDKETKEDAPKKE